MIWFEDHLYCGTFRADLCLKRRQKIGANQWPVWPIKCPEPDQIFNELDLRAQIWRFSPLSLDWGGCLPVTDRHRTRRSADPARMRIPRHGRAARQKRCKAGALRHAFQQHEEHRSGHSWIGRRSYFPCSIQTRARLSGCVFLPVPDGGRLYASPLGSTSRIANQRNIRSSSKALTRQAACGDR
jgi:hypothetical protein